jgi:hypothetical protein
MAAPAWWSGNGHYYLIVNVDTSFNSALSAAASSTYNGQQGYLATITSSEENAFVTSLCTSGVGYWIGGSDSQQEGTWRWVAGPESGQTISPTFWHTSQPTGSSTQDYLTLFNGVWFDETSLNYYYYVIEYGSKSFFDCFLIPPHVIAFSSYFPTYCGSFADYHNRHTSALEYQWSLLSCHWCVGRLQHCSIICCRYDLQRRTRLSCDHHQRRGKFIRSLALCKFDRLLAWWKRRPAGRCLALGGGTREWPNHQWIFLGRNSTKRSQYSELPRHVQRCLVRRYIYGLLLLHRRVWL